MIHSCCDKVEMIPSAQEFTVSVLPLYDTDFLRSRGSTVIHAVTPGGVCVRQSLQFDSGYCFLVGSSLNSTCSAALGWVLQEGSGVSAGRSAGRIMACGELPFLKLDAWHNISLTASSNGKAMTIIAVIDGTTVAHQMQPEPVKWQQGMVSLRSGYHYALFDDLALL
jgi:hypothetical protein